MVLLTLVCSYLACWGPTQDRGLRDVANFVEASGDGPNRFVDDSTIIAPCLLRIDDMTTAFLLTGHGPRPTRCYYFWFFGYVAKLPLERPIK